MKEIAPNIYVSTDYPDVTVGFIARPNGVIAVDAPTLPRDALIWRQRMVETTNSPILYTVLTDTHPHRLLCAGMLGAPIVASQTAYRHAADYTNGFWRSVIRRLKRRFPEQEDTLADVDIVLPEILFSDVLTLHRGGAIVTVKRVASNAPGTAWVDLRDEGVIFVGETLVVGTPPTMDETPDSKAWLDTLTMLRRPRFSDVALVPGRGPVSDQSATEPLSEYIRIARRRARSLHRARRPKDDVTEFLQELLSLFNVPEEKENQLERRVKNGLERVYEELAADSENDG